MAWRFRRTALAARGTCAESLVAWSNTLKPSGDCLPVDQGLRVINSVLDPRSIYVRVSPLAGLQDEPGLKYGSVIIKARDPGAMINIYT